MNKFDFKSVMHFVGVLNTDGYPSGDLAELRRMDHEAPKEAAFWKLFADLNEESRRARVDEIRWATVIKGISLMLPGPHLTKAAPGKILAQNGFSEIRLSKLLTAPTHEITRDAFIRTSRFLGAKGAALDWTQFASIVLSRTDSEKNDSLRRIARDYYLN